MHSSIRGLSLFSSICRKSSQLKFAISPVEELRDTAQREERVESFGSIGSSVAAAHAPL